MWPSHNASKVLAMSRYNDFLSRIIDESLIPRGIFIHFAFSIVFRITGFTARAGVIRKNPKNQDVGLPQWENFYFSRDRTRTEDPMT